MTITIMETGHDLTDRRSVDWISQPVFLLNDGERNWRRSG